MTGPARFRVPRDLDMVRSDRVIASVLDLPRSEVRRIIDAGGAVVAGTPVRPAQQLAAGSEVVVDVPRPAAAVLPIAVDFDVVVADDEFLVVDKPPGLVVHPGAGTPDATLVAGLLYRFPELADLEDQRWGLVHRLDRDTSGLLIVARTALAHSVLSDALRHRDITRTYLALVLGELEAATGTIDAPIGRDVANPTRQSLRQDGRQARTHYRRLASWADVTLLEVTLETGRTHQIRVHLSSIDHPVVGDRTYGSGAAQRGDPGRQWLHARRLVLAHPSHGEPVDVMGALPDDLVASLIALGVPTTGSVAHLT